MFYFPGLAYLIGCILPAAILFRVVTGKNIRNYGSGNPGTSNVWALLGWKYGVLALVVDTCKVVIVFIIAIQLKMNFDSAFMLGTTATIGHCYPIISGFQGGKGIACCLGISIGSYLYLGPVFLPIIAIGIVTFVFIFLWKRIVSLSSILMVSMVSAICWFSNSTIAIKSMVTLLAIVILIRHKSNIKRLLDGDEKPFGRRV